MACKNIVSGEKKVRDGVLKGRIEGTGRDIGRMF